MIDQRNVSEINNRNKINVMENLRANQLFRECTSSVCCIIRPLDNCCSIRRLFSPCDFVALFFFVLFCYCSNGARNFMVTVYNDSMRTLMKFSLMLFWRINENSLNLNVCKSFTPTLRIRKEQNVTTS